MVTLQPKSILFVVSDMDHGGMARHTTRLVNALAEKGQRSHVVAYSTQTGGHYYPLHGTVRQTYLQQGSSSDLSRIKRLRRIIKDERPDLIVSWLADINVRCLLAAFFLQQKVILHEASHPTKLPLSFLSRFLRVLLYPSAEKLVVQTKQAASMYPFWLQPKTFVIANPIQVNNMLLPQQNNTIITACRLSPEKNLPLLLTAFARIKELYPAWHLRIWGEGPERPVLEKLALQLGLNAKDILPGLSPTPDHWLQTGQIFAMCSAYEGLPNSLAEAMAAGYPVAVTPFACGPQDMIVSGEDGIIAPAATVEALAQALRALIVDPAKATTMGAQARSKAKRQWSVEKIVAQWQELVMDQD